MATAPPRVKLITIDGLFRQYNHRIPLHIDERVTVLHGRNGVGKTVTLSLVAALLKGTYWKLAKVPFERLRVDFDEGSYLSVEAEKTTEDGGANVLTHFSLEHKLGAKEPEVLRLWTFHDVRSPIATGSTPETAAPDGSAGQGLHYERLTRYPSVSPAPPKVQTFLRGFHLHFIEAQRLFPIVPEGDSTPKDRLAVTRAMAEIAKDMATQVQVADSIYRATSTRLDDSLPSRLFAPPKNGSKITKKELQRRTEALEGERRRLHEVGLLSDATAFNPSTLTEAQRAMFVVYLKDNEEKLAVFKNLADRAEILLSTLNRKLSPKSIKLDKDLGYKVLSHDGRPLDLDALSSGEQHELVLLHTLLFRVEPGSFLLIDEPELSLHVTWQNEFLAELIQIAKKVGFDALVATHSPYIVGERRDLMVRLGEPV